MDETSPIPPPFPPVARFRDMEEAARVFSVFDCTPFLAGLTTLEEGRYLLVNRAFTEFTGYTPEEALGRTSAELGLAHPEGRGALLARIREEGAIRNVEFPIRAKDGRTLWCLFTAHPVLVGERKVLLTTAVDITARREAERKVDEGRRLLEELAENAPAVLYQSRVHPDGTIENSYLSPSARTLLGIPGATFDEFVARIHPEDRERVGREIRAAVEAEAPFHCDFRVVKPDGAVVWLSSHALPVRHDGVLQYDGIQVDVTERVRTEEALAESRRQLEDLAANLPGVVFRTRANPDGTVALTYLSPGAEEILGLGGEPEGFYERFAACIPGEERERFAVSVVRAVEESSPWEYEGPFRRPDGQLLWISARSRPEREGGELHFNGILLDETQRFAAETALAESRRRFEELASSFPGVISQARVEPDGSIAITYLSPGAGEFFGIDTRLEGYLERFLACIHEEDRARCLGSILRAAETDEPWQFLGRFVRPDGKNFWVEAKARPIRRGPVLVSNAIFLDVTERIRADEARREAEERYRLLVETTGTGFVIIDGEGRVLDANPEYVRLAGHSRLEEILGRPVTDWTAPQDQERNAAEVAKCLRDGVARWLEVDYVSPSGVVTPIEINATVQHGAAGPRILTLCRDISERRRAEEALRESEERFSRFLDHLPAVAFIKEPGGRILLGNRFAREEIWGGDWEGRSTRETFPPDVAERMAEGDRRVLEGGGGASEEYVRDFRGEEHVFRTVKFPLPGRDGTVLVGGIGVDITDRVRAEEALRESEERFHLFLEQFPAVALIKDPEGRVLLANRYVKEKVWGRDLSGRFTQEIRGADAEQVTRDDLRALAEGGVRLEETVVDAAGDRRRFQTIKFPIPTARGTLLGVVAEDVTERRRAEEALRESEERLRLLAAHEREAVEEERGRIAREIHDELAQRLTALNMDLHWLRRHLSPESGDAAGWKVEEMIGALEETRRAVTQIVREMRPPILDDLGLAAALEWMTGDVAARSGLAVDLSLPQEELPLPFAVATAAYRIVQEALTNVVRHAGAGKACVALRITGGELRLCVCDDGRGMDPGAAAKAGSHGLAGIAERLRPLGGSLDIVGALGGGTKLSVAIPLAAPGPAGGEGPASPFPAPCDP